MTELKPCPLCEGEAYIRTVGEVAYIECADCHCQTEYVNPKEIDKIIQTWNTRPNPWHTGTPTEEGWYQTEVKVRDCDGSYYLMYESVWFDGEEWVNRRHEQPVVAWQKIEPYKETE